MIGRDKKLNPAAINSLKEALTYIYWKKSDLRDFVRNTIDHKNIISTIDWHGQTKYESVSELVDRMTERMDLFEEDLFALFAQVINFNDFTHLKRWEDPDIKIQRAMESVNAVRKHAQGYFERLEEDRRVEERKRKSEYNLQSRINLKSKLEELYQSFLKIAVSTNHHQRGYELESFLYDLFLLFDLNPKSSFKLVGEQIDGAFTFESDDYLLEARWRIELAQPKDLKTFASTVNSKRKNTLGLFFSMDGFSPDCTNLSNDDIKSIILMDGADLDAVLNERIHLDDLLYRKRRFASETGNIFLPVSKILVK